MRAADGPFWCDSDVTTATPPSERHTHTAVLDREVYSEGEAARLLQVPQGTLHYWLEGGDRRGVVYQPVIRTEPKGPRANVTWGEFVEAGLLREYRRSLPMRPLRAFIVELRDRMDIPYPLAHERPWVSGRDLLTQAQEDSHLGPEFWLVWETGQGLITSVAERFIERVSWSDDVASSYRPHDDPHSLVAVDPEIRFGRPHVGGVSTGAILEQAEAGSTDEELAETFGVTPDQVIWALAYERTVKAA